MHWADRPELYLESPALDIIKRIPSTWDETLVLKNSRIGGLAGGLCQTKRQRLVCRDH
jgi:hypothetical protein